MDNEKDKLGMWEEEHRYLVQLLEEQLMSIPDMETVPGPVREEAMEAMKEFIGSSDLSNKIRVLKILRATT